MSQGPITIRVWKQNDIYVASKDGLTLNDTDLHAVMAKMATALKFQLRYEFVEPSTKQWTY